MTIKRKMELLRMVYSIGIAITRLRFACYTEEIAIGNVERLCDSLDDVRLALWNESALQPQEERP